VGLRPDADADQRRTDQGSSPPEQTRTALCRISPTRMPPSRRRPIARAYVVSVGSVPWVILLAGEVDRSQRLKYPRPRSAKGRPCSPADGTCAAAPGTSARPIGSSVTQRLHYRPRAFPGQPPCVTSRRRSISAALRGEADPNEIYKFASWPGRRRRTPVAPQARATKSRRFTRSPRRRGRAASVEFGGRAPSRF